MIIDLTAAIASYDTVVSLIPLCVKAFFSPEPSSVVSKREVMTSTAANLWAPWLVLAMAGETTAFTREMRHSICPCSIQQTSCNHRGNDYTLGTHAAYDGTRGEQQESNKTLYQLLSLCGEDAIETSNLMYTPDYAIPGKDCLHPIMQPVRKHQALATLGCPLSYFRS